MICQLPHVLDNKTPAHIAQEAGYVKGLKLYKGLLHVSVSKVTYFEGNLLQFSVRNIL